MRVFMKAAMFAAATAIWQPAAVVRADGPIREGLRDAGSAVVEGTGRVVQGAGQVVRGAGQAAAGVVDQTGQAVGNIAGATARGVRAGVNAVTPARPWQSGYRGWDQGREAQWRFRPYNGEWWYYTDNGNWMYHRNGRWNEYSTETYQPLEQNQQLADQGYQGQYSAGYGSDQAQQGVQPQADQGQLSGPVYQLHVDRNGREYICDNGQRLYVTSSSGQAGQYGGEQSGGQQYSAGYAPQGEAGQYMPTPAPPLPQAGVEGSTAAGQIEGQQSVLQGRETREGQIRQGQIQQGQTQRGMTQQGPSASATSPQPRSQDAQAGATTSRGQSQPQAQSGNPTTGAAASPPAAQPVGIQARSSIPGNDNTASPRQERSSPDTPSNSSER